MAKNSEGVLELQVGEKGFNARLYDDLCDMVGLLRLLEWTPVSSHETEARFCRICGRDEYSGHQFSCALRRAVHWGSTGEVVRE